MSIKKLINSHPNINIDRMKSKIEQYDVVSFDIFDTLIKRDVACEDDKFDLVERVYNKSNVPISGFKRNRVKAEKKAREYSEEEEITITDIYFRLQDVYGEKIAQKLQCAEKYIELNICHSNTLIKEFYDYCVEKKKTIIMVSDMYWGTELICDLLHRNGYKYYDYVFLSSVYKKQKRTGNLYKIVSSKYKGQRIIHIGDNKKGDFLRAIQSGMATISIPKFINNTDYLPEGKKLDSRCIHAFVNNRLNNIESHNMRIGYEVYGPLLFGFVNWLSSLLSKEKTTLFFARDCYVVKPAFEFVSGTAGENVYFYGSRKGLIVPALYINSSLENVQRLIKSEPVQMTIRGLLAKVGLVPSDYKDQLAKYSLSLDTVVYRDKLLQNSNFVSFYNSILADIKSNAYHEYHNFMKYFTSLNPTKEIQVIDIGWRCTMQYCLQELLPDYDIKGFYLGVREDAYIDHKDYEGLYLDGVNDVDKKTFLAAITALIEIFFSAPHGSIIGYDTEGVPIYDVYECEDDNKHKTLIEELQRGSLLFIENYSKSCLADLVSIGSEDIFAALESMGLNPRKLEVQMFSDYPFHMGIGIVKAASPNSLLSYIGRPRKFLFDFSNSNWKIAFLKKLFLIRLPYYKIFKVMYKHKG